MSSKPVLSIVVETGTRQFTGRISFKKMMQSHLAEAKRTLSDSQFELIFVGTGDSPKKLPKNCRYLDRPQTGYYGFKNDGSKAARGKYVLFWDSDCRANKGYIKLLLGLFKDNPDLIAIGGRTFYDNQHLFGRVNTIFSFGPFCRAPERLTDLSVITHNVSILKSAFPSHPFGPYTARSGGDIFLTQYALKKGKPVLFDKRLVIFHEDISTHFGATMERRVRDLFHPALFMKSKSQWEVLARGFVNCPMLFLKRIRRILIYRKDFNIRCWELPGVALIMVSYAFLEISALLIMTAYPPLLSKWLNFQFGPKWMKTQGINQQASFFYKKPPTESREGLPAITPT